MPAIHKSKQYWLVALKVLLLVVAFAYLYLKIKDESVIVSPFLKKSFNTTTKFLLLLPFIVLACINWLLEIVKWKTVVQTNFPISFTNATKQSLGSLTASIITPNRIGEYGAKALYFSKEKRKKILFLNFVHNSSQLLATLLFGIPAFVFFLWKYRIPLAQNTIILTVLILFALLLIGFVFRKRQLGIKGFSFENLWKHFKEISTNNKIVIIAISLLRYAIFSTLYTIMLQFFGAHQSYLEVAPVVFSAYLLVSVIPSYFLADVVIRGSVAVWLFSFLNIPEITVLTTVFFMWLLNVVIPAIFGSYYVLTFKTSKQ